jgi:ferredoxin-NADP reductase
MSLLNQPLPNIHPDENSNVNNALSGYLLALSVQKLRGVHNFQNPAFQRKKWKKMSEFHQSLTKWNQALRCSCRVCSDKGTIGRFLQVQSRKLSGSSYYDRKVHNLARQLSNARLLRKVCLSESTQCYHFEFAAEEVETLPLKAGQFVSMVAEDTNGKQQTRAYSIASAERRNEFDLCINRVDGGFFSNLICDLKVGETVKFHGPHGLFTLREPISDTIMAATGTGISPMRGFVQWLFPESGEDRSNGKQIWLVYGTRYLPDLYYKDEFEAIAARHPNFHYITTLSRENEGYTGNRGYVQDYVKKIVETRGEVPALADGSFSIHTYICGLNNMVSAVRDHLVEFGWDKKQVIYERYD